MKASAADKKRFLKDFREGLEFWTSEDGSLISIAIMNTEKWKDVLLANYSHRIKDFNERHARPRWASREWAGGEYFDGRCGRTRGKIWRLTDEVTPFGVIEYDLNMEVEVIGCFTDGDGIERACRYLGPVASDYEEEHGLIRVLYWRDGERVEGVIRPFEFRKEEEAQ